MKTVSLKAIEKHKQTLVNSLMMNFQPTITKINQIPMNSKWAFPKTWTSKLWRNPKINNSFLNHLKGQNRLSKPVTAPLQSSCHRPSRTRTKKMLGIIQITVCWERRENLMSAKSGPTLNRT
jgi:hypothetical protein